MPFKIEGDTRVECSECGHEFSIPEDVFEFVLEGETEKTNGTERLFVAGYNGKCENCGEDISIRYEAWEYPQGVHNDSEIHFKGVSLISQAKVRFEVGDL